MRITINLNRIRSAADKEQRFSDHAPLAIDYL